MAFPDVALFKILNSQWMLLSMHRDVLCATFWYFEIVLSWSWKILFQDNLNIWIYVNLYKKVLFSILDIHK
jgi:hypothetical protein